MSQMPARLSHSIHAAKTVQIHKDSVTVYPFKLYAFGERGTYLEPELMLELTDYLAAGIEADFPAFDYIVSPEPGGHTWGMLAACKLHKPVNILRLSTELYEDFQICIRRETAYNENFICFDGFKEGDRVLLVDDVISSGATIRCIAAQLKLMGVTLVGVQAILAKGAHYLKLEQDLGVPVHCLGHV